MSRSLLSESDVAVLEKQSGVAAASPMGSTMATVRRSGASDAGEKLAIPSP